MRLSELLNGYKYESTVEDTNITGITSDSRQVKEGYAFVCIKGVKSDGHSYAQKALESGAAAIICESDINCKNMVKVADSRKVYAGMCANFFKNPARKLKMIGVTGTNGKTSTVAIIKAILEHCGKKTGLMGTIHNEIGDITLPARHTTPDPYYLHGMLSRMVKHGCEYVVMEVSSHALSQHRLEGIHFEVGVFTNLTQDHLDYHENMENYYLAKKKLFDISEHAVINLDDEYGRKLAKEITCNVKTYSTSDDMADFTAKSIVAEASGSKFAFVGNGTIARMKTNTPGDFSVSNAMAAVSACINQGFDVDQIAPALDEFKGVSGRLEVIAKDKNVIIRDYAHSPDALKKLLKTVRKFTSKRVVLLFGCPGERDRSKREYMGEVAAIYSDYVIFTEDNPRREDQSQIVEDTQKGFAKYKTECKIINDRYEAIKCALKVLNEGDILVLAGKGHEDYQVKSDATHYFDEKEIVLSLINLPKGAK